MMEVFRAWLASFQRQPAPPAVDASIDLHIDELGVLHGDRVIYLPSKRGRTSAQLARGEPLGVVSHWTATDRGTGLGIARRTVPYHGRTDQEHSQHVTIDVAPSARIREAECRRLRNDGLAAQARQVEELPEAGWVIYQNRTFREMSWHAGSPSSAKINGQSANSVTIGVEHCAYGQVARRLDGHWRAWVSGRGVGYGAIVPPDQVGEVAGRAYHLFALEILAGRDALYAELQRAYPSLSGPQLTITPSAITRQRISVRDPRLAAWAEPKFAVDRMCIGHGMLDPTRKGEEPGPLF